MNDPSPVCPRCGARLARGSRLGALCPRCLLALALAQSGQDTEDAPDQTFGPYRLIRKIGEGGMGIVWLARQEHPIRRDVALKVVKPGADSAQVLARFESERQALAILNHPNIATVFDAGLTDDGRPYFAMEFVPGMAITTFADQRALPIADRLELFVQVCEAVEHAHQKGVLHRDLKPANILVAERDGRQLVKVIDFGVAKALGDDRLSAATMETQIGSLVGTPEYMSPEQAGLTQATVDTRTDIYALGLVLYELLVGALPFDAGELRRKALLEMLRVIREDDPPPLASRLTGQTDAEIREVAKRRLTEPRTLVRQLRGDLEWITNRALEKEPARRYASASELGTDVRRHLAHEPVAAGPPDLRYRLGKLIRRHRVAAVAAGVTVAALVASALLSTVMWVRADRARRDTRRQLSASLVAGGIARLDAWDWAGGLLSFVNALEADPDRAHEQEHRIRIAQVLERMPKLARLWAHGIRITSIDLSVDGLVASAGTDGNVRVWSLHTGEPIATAIQHSAGVHHVAFSPDGRLLASASADGTARIWRVGDRQLLPVTMRHDRDVEYIAFSPDSRIVATAGTDGWLRLWRIGEDQPYVQQDLGTPVARVIFTSDGTRFAAAARQRENDPFTVRLLWTANGAAAGEVIRGEAGWFLTDADLSADGTQIVTAGYQGCYCARVWNAATGERVAGPLVHRNTVHTARFNGNGTQVVTGGYDRVVQVWRVPSGEAAAAPWSIAGWPEMVRFTRDGQLLAASSAGTVEIVTPAPSAGRENLRLFPTLTHAGPVTAAVVDGSGRFLVSGGADGAVRVWDLAPTLPAEAPFAWYASEWTTEILLGGADRQLVTAFRVFDRGSGLPLTPPMRVDSNQFYMTISRDGRRIATAGSHRARVWDAATGEPVSPVLTHTRRLSAVRALALSADGQRLLTLSSSDGVGDAIVWDVGSGAPALTLTHDAPVTTGAFSPDGTMVMTATSARTTNLRLWKIPDGSLAFSAQHPEGVYMAAFDPSGQRLVTVGSDQRVLEWRIGAPAAPTTLLELRSEPSWLGIHGSSIVAGGRGGDISVRTRGRDDDVASFTQAGAVLSADISPNHEWLVTSGDDGRAELWSLRTRERLGPSHRAGGPVERVQFLPDGSAFALGAAGVSLQQIAVQPGAIDVLKDAAELLSARELVDARDRPLRLEQLVAKWQRTADFRKRDAAPPAAWLRRQAVRLLSRNNAAAAIEQLESLRTIDAWSWSDRLLHLAALARTNRWTDVVNEIDRLGAARDAAPELIFIEAVARRRAGDVEGVRALCGALLQRHGATRNPDRALWILRACLLDPAAATGPAWSVTAPLVEQVYDLRLHGTTASIAGAIAVRSGKFDEGIRLLERAAADGERTPHTALFLAMALARSNRASDAIKWLAEADKFVFSGGFTFSQATFRTSWLQAEAAILREELAPLLAPPRNPSAGR